MDPQQVQVVLILGSMFSGKSTELIRQMHRFQAIGKNTLLVSPMIDTRKSNGLRIHDGRNIKATKVANLEELWEQLDDIDAIFVDEGQFFEDLVSFSLSARKRTKSVYIAALDGDFKQNMFPVISEILPKVDFYQKCLALCMECKNGKTAPFTKRKTTTDKELIVVGGKDIYCSVCWAHLHT